MSNKDNTTLEGLLNEVDYSYFNDQYIPSVEALQFITFIKLVNGEQGEENKSPIIHMDMIDGANATDNNLYVSFRGSAKALAVGTLIMTPTGVCPIEQLVVGDYVIDRNGEATQVTTTSDTFNNQTYKFILADGSEFIANEDHIHILQRRTVQPDHSRGKLPNGKWPKNNIWKEECVTTEELLKRGAFYNRTVTKRNPSSKDQKWFVPLINNTVQYTSNDFPIEPYMTGVILGDGNVDKKTGTPTLVSHTEDIKELRNYLKMYDLGDIYWDKRNPDTGSFRVRGIGGLVKQYIGTNTSYKKHIPTQLLYGSETERIAVLRGLMDTDGTITLSGHSSFCSASVALAEGVRDIVKSLGGHARLSRHANAYAGYYLVSITLPKINPFLLNRKASRWIEGKQYKSGVRTGIKDIIKMPLGIESKCISVASPTESYLIEGSIVTHNTTALHEYMFLYIATYGSFFDFGTIDVAMYVSDTIDNGVKSMRKQLEFRWNNSDFLKMYVPYTKFTDVRWEFINKEGKAFCVRGFGASTGVRGFKEYGKRPTWLGMDDLMSDKNAESATIVKDIKNIIYKAARQAMHPKKRKIIWTGTPFNQRDPLYSAACSKGWNTKVYPICEQYPCTREEFKGAWEDRFTYDFVKNEYDTLLANGEISAFNQELMLRIMSDEDRLIQDHDINWYSRPTLLSNKAAFNFYITTDFATSAAKAADFSVISVWALNHKGFWYYVDGICKKQLMDQNLNDLFRLAQTYKPLEVGVEISGQQGGFVQWIQNEMMERNIFFNLAKDGGSKKPGIRPTTDKITRFNLVVPWFKANMMWFPTEMKETPMMEEAMNELTLVSQEGFKSKHDDFSDTVSMLASLKTFRPSEELLGKQVSDGPYEFDDERLDEDRLSSYVV